MDSQKDYTQLDEATAPFQEILAGVSRVAGQAHAEGMGMSIAEITVDMPFEVDVHVDPEEHITLGTTPPHTWEDVSVAPVLHRIRFTLAQTETLEAPKTEDNPSDEHE